MVRSYASIFQAPAPKAFLLLIGGILIEEFIAPPFAAILIALIVVTLWVAVLAFIGRQRLTVLRSGTTAASIVLLGALLYTFHNDTLDGDILSYTMEDEPVEIQGCVVSIPERRHSSIRFDLQIQSLDSNTIKSSPVVRTSWGVDPDTVDIPPLTPGDTVIFEAYLRSPGGLRNPHGFNYRRYLNLEGVVAVAYPYNEDKLLSHRSAYTFPGDMLFGIRTGIRATVERLFPDATSPTVLALVTGERGTLANEVSEEYRRSGLAHLLAISGLHVGILYLILIVLCTRLPLRWRSIAILAILWLNVLITGGNPPVLRATLIVTVFELGRLLQRTASPMQSISLAGFIILLFDPADLFSVGFQLSFAAVIAIALFYPRIMTYFRYRFHGLDGKPWLYGLLQMLAVTLCAQLGTAPIALVHFGSFNMLAVVLNLGAIPLMFVAVAAQYLGLMVSLISIQAGVVFAVPAHLALNAIQELAAFGSQQTLFTIDAVGAAPWLLAFYVALLYYVLKNELRIAQRAAVAFGCIAAVIAISSIEPLNPAMPPMKVAFLDVGQGDACVVTTPDGAAMLIDAGPSYRSGDEGERTIVPYLRGEGIRDIDALVLTHSDNDHIGGTASVCAYAHVDRLYYTGLWETDETVEHTEDAIEMEHTWTKSVAAGDTIALGEFVRVYVLSPSQGDPFAESTNESSVVLQIVYENTSFLLTGDAGEDSEVWMTSHFGDALESDVLKAGHHGSNSSSSLAFLRTVRADHIVYSCGVFNKHGHPDEEVEWRAALFGSTPHRTDTDGAVIFTSDGEQVHRLDWKQ